MKPAPTLSLAEIAHSVQYGYTASADDTAIGPKFLRITDIVPTQIDWNTVPYCRIDEKKFAKFSLAPGDIVIARTGATVGHAKLIRENEPSVFASYLVRVRIDPNKADPGYVGRIVESDVYKRFVLSRIGGSAQPNANARVLSSFRLPLPERSDQTRIVSILSTYDDLIENNRRRIQLLEQATRLLYKEWFVRLRFPGHQHTMITNGFPEGWKRKTAFEMMDILSGGTPKTTVPNYWNGDIPFFTPKDATTGAYVFSTEKTLTKTGLQSCNSKLYPKYTVFITARGTVGKISLAQTSMAMNQWCYALIARPPLNQHFLYFSLVEGVKQFSSRAVGTVFDAIIRDTFKQIPFLVPDNTFIRMFSEHSIPTLRLIDVLSHKIRLLTQARDQLLPRIMGGGIAV